MELEAIKNYSCNLSFSSLSSLHRTKENATKTSEKTSNREFSAMKKFLVSARRRVERGLSDSTSMFVLTLRDNN